mgnify:CR=1 FL=1
MIHRTGLTRTQRWLARALFVVMALVGMRNAPPLEAPVLRTLTVTPIVPVLTAQWKGGTTVYRTENVPAQPVTLTRRSTFTPQSEAFAKAACRARTPVRPSTALPRSAWGDARWCPVTGQIDYRPFRDPSLLFYIGAVQQAVGTMASYRAAIGAAGDTDIVEMTADVPIDNLANGNPDILTYPTRGDSGWVLVRTSSYASLPAVSQSTFAVPASKPASNAWASHPKFLKNIQYAAPILHANGSRGWHFRGIQYYNNRLTTQGNGQPTGMAYKWGTSANTYTNQPTYMVMDQCSFDSRGENQSGYSMLQNMSLNGEYFIVRRSRMSAIGDNTEFKCIGGASGLGKGLIVDNTLNGSSMHIIFGGSATGLSGEYNSDIIVRQNYGHRADNELNAAWTAGVKNHYETKNGTRCVWEGNSNYGHDGRGQIYDWSIGAKCNSAAEELYVQTWDCLIRHNFTRNGAAPIGFFNTAQPTTGYANVQGVRRVEFYNNLAIDPSNAPATNQCVQALFGQTNQRYSTDCKVHANTVCVRRSVPIVISAVATGVGVGGGFNMTNNVFFRVASSSALSYMIQGSGATASQTNAAGLDIACGAGQWTCDGNLTNSSTDTDTQAWGSILATTFGNRCKTSTTMNFLNTATYDYTLSEAAYQTMGVGGVRPGVNMTFINALLTDVTA